ncbi:MAG: CoB--CoM heterodisulfide reductase iron-sulfur subunit A family protein [Thermoplasmata archaeon]|nr:MAG: CoB--CoM heterodisulfide reductase iron-sulfur subunit A family protein [Thermoplasmata archaeon]
MRRIGIFVCHCGKNIAGTVDVKRVVEEASKHPDVVYAVDYTYMCSDPGQDMIKDAIKNEKLDGVIVASCTPSLHENTFRKAISKADLNQYQFECANIREQCSWVHQDMDKATKKAITIINSMVEKLRENSSLSPTIIPITKKALVIGAGIAGMQAAIDIANSGYDVTLLEKNPSIGGRMSQLAETFPTLDCASCILTPKMVEVGQHPKIKLMTYSEVDDVSGYVGNFKVKIRRKAACVDWDKCNGCGTCFAKCPTKISSEHDRGMGKRKAIYTPFPQAVPNKPVIDREHCQWFLKEKCGNCKKVCPLDAVDYEQEDSFIEDTYGAIVVATGFDLMPIGDIGEYGYGKVKDVIDSLQFERLLSASGPTQGEIKRPSDGKIPKEVVFIQCAGSRDPEHGVAYCSKICCMYTAKHAFLYKHAVSDGQAYIFYIDIRSAGKNYEEFVQRGIEEEDLLYLRGKVSKVFQEGDKVVVWGADTLTGKKIEIKADMVVLAMAAVPSIGTKELAKKLRISTDEYGWLSEAHPKLRPLETLTAGIFLAGAAQAPKDIPETVATSSGAASKVVSLFTGEGLSHDPMIAFVDEEVCVGCGNCVSICAYNAAELDERKGVSKINEGLCEGCGACAAGCPSGALTHKNYSKKQIFDMLSAVTED